MLCIKVLAHLLILKMLNNMMNLVIIAGRTIIGATAKELAILATAYVADKCLNRKKLKEK